MREIDYVTGSKTALSDPMVALLQYLAATEHDVRYLKGVNITHQYTWFKENRISVRTWKALEDRGLIEKPKTGMSTPTAEGYRALLQFGNPADLRQAVLDAAHADATNENLERQLAGIDQRQAERAAHLDAGDETLASLEPVTYEPCGCLTNSAGAHRGDCPAQPVTEEELAEYVELFEAIPLAEGHSPEELAPEFPSRVQAEDGTQRAYLRKLAAEHGWRVTADGLADYGDAWERDGKTLVAVYRFGAPDAPYAGGEFSRGCVGTWTRPVEPITDASAITLAWAEDTLKSTELAEFIGWVVGRPMDVSVAADALLDERMTEEIPGWGSEPEHAVQAVWAHRNLTGMAPTREVLTRPYTRDMIEDRAIDMAVQLGWLECMGEKRDADAQYASFRVADRVRNLAMLRAAERHRDYSVAVLDSRVLASDTDGVIRLTVGTRNTADPAFPTGRWYLVRERVSPTTLELVYEREHVHGSKAVAQYDLTSRVSSLLGWGWSQAFRFTGDGVTPVR